MANLNNPGPSSNNTTDIQRTPEQILNSMRTGAACINEFEKANKKRLSITTVNHEKTRICYGEVCLCLK